MKTGYKILSILLFWSFGVLFGAGIVFEIEYPLSTTALSTLIPGCVLSMLMIFGGCTYFLDCFDHDSNFYKV